MANNHKIGTDESLGTKLLRISCGLEDCRACFEKTAGNGRNFIERLQIFSQNKQFLLLKKIKKKSVRQEKLMRALMICKPGYFFKWRYPDQW